MRLFSRGAIALAVTILLGCLAGAMAQQPENIPQQNSDAIARKLAGVLLERQIGAKVPAERFGAYEVDFNLDGFSEIYVYVQDPACDGVKCGLFLFVLEGDGYREVLGDIPGARLTDPAKVGLGAFKRKGFIDLQLNQTLASWNGERYADSSTFPASSLDGTAFIAACRKNKSSEQPEEGEAERVTSECQCQFNRFQTIGFAQADLDTYAASFGENFVYPTGDREKPWQALVKDAEDVGTGCDVVSGKSQWQPAYFNHGDQQQQKLDFDAFLDACPAQNFILTNRKTGSPDRALGLCGCLARELPTQGVTQTGMDLLAQYYRDEISDADIDAQDSELLAAHDKASDACLAQFPAK
ncbi:MULTISPECIES: hypothetical protein [unclassified Mesorhizobium]|uniref:hypothetical protein n=1 Tax=unclassified Mesorhizobium TaxID=325217 RepID=UPI000FE52C33|nr:MULTISPECIES: hypothetical protein [unclassified Mesorhizobium]RWC91606.1 MAG: hypothetical protein EOS72_02815 [Mesorhizobium sp.]TGQ95340.1 hypothetical protein EN851_07400 [Mesorhizobium sp. M8A.F.Ca.ET.208.01.1.1]TGT44168.1 hypothetical protein EN808_07255 [Mesorhizobium sp. M8A.F.Ca.ET.165.01.1.1]TGT55831.1 hypothetical protein EN810_07400 [Mesorhizobium sp. M8A.F.Ca.ET.167.01.1.1]